MLLVYREVRMSESRFGMGDYNRAATEVPEAALICLSSLSVGLSFF